MKHLTRVINILAFLMLLLSFKESVGVEKTILDRIEYVYNLKALVSSEIWPKFTDPKFDVPLVYYSDSNCYVANPPYQFIQFYHPELIYDKVTLKIYKTKILDSIPFHMETNLILDDSTSDYGYKVPFVKCSGPELTDKFVPGVHSIEMWSTMVMHEYFHGFQFKHPQFLNFFEKYVNMSADTLNVLYKNNHWFKKSVKKENKLLLMALDSETQTEIQQLIIHFFKLRNQRLKQTKELLNSDIKIIEESYELLEGTARYIEYNLYQKFAMMPPDITLLKSDPLFHSYRYFKDYSIKNDKWLFRTGVTYYAAIGFNIVRLLDKLKVDYKTRLFNEKIFLNDILREQIETADNNQGFIRHGVPMYEAPVELNPFLTVRKTMGIE